MIKTITSKPKAFILHKTESSLKNNSENAFQIEDALCFNLYTASRLMSRAYAEHLDSMNITYPQFLVIHLLDSKDKVILKSLGERLYLDSGTLTPLINRLVKMGYVKKEKSLHDEREINIFLTLKGKNLKRKSAEFHMAMFCKLNVSSERFAEIKTGVQQILSNLNHHIKNKKNKKMNSINH